MPGDGFDQPVEALVLRHRRDVGAGEGRDRDRIAADAARRRGGAADLRNRADGQRDVRYGARRNVDRRLRRRLAGALGRERYSVRTRPAANTKRPCASVTVVADVPSPAIVTRTPGMAAPSTVTVPRTVPVTSAQRRQRGHANTSAASSAAIHRTIIVSARASDRGGCRCPATARSTCRPSRR